MTTSQPLPADCESLIGDLHDAESLRATVGNRSFDVVVDFMTFTPDHVQQHIDLFGDRMGQYMFISSTSAYQTPPTRLPIVESSPLRNPY